MRVSVVLGKLMLLIGEDSLKFVEAQFDLINNSGFFQVLEILRASCCGKAAKIT